MKYTLKYPLAEREAKTDAMRQQLELDAYTEIEFREMTVDDMLKLDEVDGQNHRVMKLMELLSGKRPRQLKRMCPKDFNGAARVLDDMTSEENDGD